MAVACRKSGLIIPFLLAITSDSITAQPFALKHNSKLQLQNFWISPDSDSLNRPRLTELSGLCCVYQGNSAILAIQDGGNSSDIWVFSGAGNQGLSHVRLELINKDWEAISADCSSLYVGDFGNNRGNRTDLVIYRITGVLQELGKHDFVGSVAVDTIGFQFADQRKFTSRLFHNFDCESMLLHEDFIWVLSKNWLNFRCNVYELPNIPGEHSAKRIGKIRTRFLVTDACWAGADLWVVGYSLLGKQFIAQVDAVTFKIKAKRTLPLSPGQVEGVTYCLENNQLYIATEARKSQPGAVYRVGLR